MAAIAFTAFKALIFLQKSVHHALALHYNNSRIELSYIQIDENDIYRSSNCLYQSAQLLIKLHITAL